MSIAIRPYYPVGSASSTRSALSRRAYGVFARETDAEPAFVSFGYPGWLFKSHVYKADDRMTKVPAHFTMPTPEQARRLVPGAFGVLSK